MDPHAARTPFAILVVLGLVLAGCLGDDERDDAEEPAYADLVLQGGHIWIGGATNATASALAVANGTIVYVGDEGGIASFIGPDTRVYELEGGTVLPGLRDHHNHLIQYSNPNPDPEKRRLGAAAPDAYRPTYEVDPAGTAAFRAAVFAYHSRVFAEERSPVDNCMENPVTETMKQNLLVAQEEALKQGLVATVEAGLDDLGQYQALLDLDAEGRLKLRFLVRWAWGCLDEAVAKGWTQDHGTQHVKVVGLKLYSDGWLGPRSAAMQEPYDDRPTFDGYLFLDPARAAADVARARELGFRITTHAIGDRAIRAVLDAYEENGVTPDDRWAIEHASVFPADLQERFIQDGVIASVQLSFATSDQHFLRDAIGEREDWTYPWRTIIDNGMQVVGSSDFQIEVLHPLWGVQRAVTRQEVDGTPPGGYYPQEALTLEQALRLVTSQVAYTTGEDHERGTLEVGKRADIVAYKEPLFDLPHDRLAGATLRLVLVDGDVAFEGEQAYPPPPPGTPLGPRTAHAAHAHAVHRHDHGHPDEHATGLHQGEADH